MSAIFRTGRICPVMFTMCGTINSRVRGVIAPSYSCTSSSSDAGSMGSDTILLTMPCRFAWSANMSSIAP